MESKKEKLQELLNDESFAEGYSAAETKEDLQKLFADNGIEMTMEDIDSLLADMPEEKNGEGELSDEALENVAGGASIKSILIGGGIIGYTCPRCLRRVGCFGHVCKRGPIWLPGKQIW